MDERWVHPSPRALAERDISSWTARSRFVVEDLLSWPRDRVVVAEGPSAFPWWVAPLLRSSRQAIFLIPTAGLRAFVLARRHRDEPQTSIAAQTTDPERARRNMAERDALMATRIVASCEALGLRYERVDGSLDLDDSLALLEDQFRPLLPTTANA